MILLGILFGAGVIVGMSVAGLVYLDCERRDRSVFNCLVRAFAYGGGSFAGFLVPYVFRQELLSLYYQMLKPRPIVVSPYESLLVSLTTGLVVAIVLVSLHLAKSRFWNQTASEPH